MTKRIFFGLSGGLGPVLRCLPVAEHFRRSGHTAAFSIYGEGSAAFIESRGFKHLPDDDPTVPSAERMIAGGPVFYNLDHYYAGAGLLDPDFVQAWIHHRIRMLEKFNADLVITDMSPHTAIAARYLGIPVASITQSCFHPDGQPVHYWGRPPRNLPRVTPVVNRVLDRLGLPDIRRMEQLNAGTLNFIPGIPEMDPVYTNGVRYVGPIEYPAAGPAGARLPDEPFVLVYPGRLQDTAGATGLQLLNHVAEAFGGKEEAVVIAASDGLPDRLKAGLPGNITVIPYFNSHMLENCRLFIHHGGHGSCLSAIMRGIPSLILPTHTEREFNARKVQETGAGEYILPGTFTADHLYKLAMYVAEDGYKERAGELASLIRSRNYGGAREIYKRCMSLMNRRALALEEL
ncbi:glycosyltransferase [Paenibacillus sp. RC84]|uniref:glycosyltransferase n=1 Tax=Paenibacillus sp. RC84 TaxID=3156252 RepID=UPI0035148C46